MHGCIYKRYQATREGLWIDGQTFRDTPCTHAVFSTNYVTSIETAILVNSSEYLT